MGFARDQCSSVETKGYAFYAGTEYLYGLNSTFVGGLSANQFCKWAGRAVPVELAHKVTNKPAAFIAADDNITLIAQRDALDRTSPAALALCAPVFDVFERFEDLC